MRTKRIMKIKTILNAKNSVNCEPMTIKIDDLWPAFVVYVFGMIFGIIVFLFEMIGKALKVFWNKCLSNMVDCKSLA